MTRKGASHGDVSHRILCFESSTVARAEELLLNDTMAMFLSRFLLGEIVVDSVRAHVVPTAHPRSASTDLQDVATNNHSRDS